jgi:hypothetical protein
MRGDVVMVRTFGGKPLKRRVWEVAEGVAYLANDKQYERLAAGKPAFGPIGFPLEDVFGSTAQDLSESLNWSDAIPWQSLDPEIKRPISVQRPIRQAPIQLLMFSIEV